MLSKQTAYKRQGREKEVLFHLKREGNYLVPRMRRIKCLLLAELSIADHASDSLRALNVKCKVSSQFNRHFQKQTVVLKSLYK